MHTYKRSNLMLLSTILTCPWIAHADFEPIALTSNSFNQDVVVEKTAPPPVVKVTTASMDGGNSNSGFTWYERGYVTDWPATGLPEAGSVLTSDQSPDYQYQLPFSYKTNNAAMIDTDHAVVVLTLTSATNYAALSFLTSSGGARNLIQYFVHYEDKTSERGTFTSPNWYNDGDPAWAANGRVNVTTFENRDLNSYNPRLYSVDISLSNRVSPIVSLELSLAQGAGHTVIFAVSGANALCAQFLPVGFDGYNEDIMVEAGAIKPGFLDYNTTATMDNGTANTRCTWYEKGYYRPAPETGLPEPGSVLTSETDPGHHFQMPPSYTDTNAVLIDAVSSNSVLTLVVPACYSALSFLTAAGHGPVTNRCVINHSDASSETNSFISPDWLGNSPAAFSTHGRVSVNTKIIDKIGTDSPRLYAVDVPIADARSPVTNIVLSLLGAGSDTHAVVFAVSGSPATLPPVRPSLQIVAAPDGQISLHSTQPGRLQSASSVSVPDGSWKDEGPISQTLILSPPPTQTLRFYRVLAQ
jgi:hypothetical protein